MLPRGALAVENMDFGDLASRFAMSGGYIKNAALRAAYLAASEGRQIEMTHLMRAATTEYASMGKVMTSGRGLDAVR